MAVLPGRETRGDSNHRGGRGAGAGAGIDGLAAAALPGRADLHCS